MECKKCREVNEDTGINILEGGYITRLCENCINRFQSDLYTMFPFNKQVRYRYLQRLEELTEDQSSEVTKLLHEYFFFSKKWIEGDFVHADQLLDTVEKMWGGEDA